MALAPAREVAERILRYASNIDSGISGEPDTVSKYCYAFLEGLDMVNQVAYREERKGLVLANGKRLRAATMSWRDYVTITAEEAKVIFEADLAMNDHDAAQVMIERYGIAMTRFGITSVSLRQLVQMAVLEADLPLLERTTPAKTLSAGWSNVVYLLACIATPAVLMAGAVRLLWVQV